MSLVDTFKELRFYDYLIDHYDNDTALPYMKLKEDTRDTYLSFNSADYIKGYFDECDYVICVTAQTNANIMHLFFYIDNKYYFRSTHNDDTIISILKTYGPRLLKLSEHQETNHA